jgi:molybdopterin-containing oxidoreductase family membrane subunit
VTGATGLSQSVMWGVVIINMIFFLGISTGALLVAVALRFFGGVRWRPAMRVAELLAIAALVVGGPQALLDLGRPHRVRALIGHLHLASPMAWDVLAISLYGAVLVATVWVSLVPDAAILRDRRRDRWGAIVYRVIALGYVGTDAQRRRWRRASAALALGAAMVAIAARVVLALVPGLSSRPTWQASWTVPAFLLGAVFSGLAALILLLSALRLGALRDALPAACVAGPGRWLALASCTWALCTFAEYAVAWGGAPVDRAVIAERLRGGSAPVFWPMAAAMLSPVVLLIRREAGPHVVAFVAALALVGSWAERWILLVPPQLVGRLPGVAARYHPSRIEVLELALSAAALVGVLVLLARILPVVTPADAGPAPGSAEP